MAEDTLRRANAKVAEKEQAMEALDRSVRWMERELARTVAKVKEEEVDEVVEVEEEAEEMEEGIVKEKMEAKVVVETPARGGGEPMAQDDDGVEGAIQDLPWYPAVVAGSHPPNLDTPLLVAPESPVWTLRFLLVRVHHWLLERGGRYAWTRGGLSTWTDPCASGWSTGGGGGNVSCRGRGRDGGRCAPPPKGG